MGGVIVASKLSGKHGHVLSVVQSATVDVFATMLGMSVTIKDTTPPVEITTSNDGLMAILGMAGAVSGSGSLCLSENLACRAASRFLMAEYSEVNDEVLDAIAELCNMIVGGLKTSLEEEFGPMGLSMPTVIYGKDYVTRRSNMGERMGVTFEYQEDAVTECFTVVVSLIEENSSRNYLKELAKFHAELV